MSKLASIPKTGSTDPVELMANLAQLSLIFAERTRLQAVLSKLLRSLAASRSSGAAKSAPNSVSPWKSASAHTQKNALWKCTLDTVSSGTGIALTQMCTHVRTRVLSQRFS